MWEKDLLGCQTAKSLVRTIYFYVNGKLFGIRSKEHRNPRVYNFRMQFVAIHIDRAENRGIVNKSEIYETKVCFKRRASHVPNALKTIDNHYYYYYYYYWISWNASLSIVSLCVRHMRRATFETGQAKQVSLVNSRALVSKIDVIYGACRGPSDLFSPYMQSSCSVSFNAGTSKFQIRLLQN
jgi:hypothetical protein